MIGRGRDLSRRRDVLRFVVRREEALRLDRYLRETLAWRSRTRIQRMIRAGHVRVGGKPTKPSRKVRPHDVVTVHLSSGTGLPADWEERGKSIETIYEDPWLIAVSKPPDLLVHPVGRHVYDTLINVLHHRFHRSASRTGEAIVPRLCHRLDRDTTGLVVVAKDRWVHREVSYQFENRLVTKRYLCLVEGRYPLDARRIDLPIGEGRCLRSALEHPILRESTTEVRVLERLDDLTLLECTPRTGRQNQIRVHLAARGYPIVGDTRYGAPAPPAGFPNRHLLHSRQLGFWHPRLKSAIDLEAPPPPDFQAALDRAKGRAPRDIGRSPSRPWRAPGLSAEE